MMNADTITVPTRTITREQTVSELQSVFDQIIATGGVKSMEQAANLCGLFNVISDFIGSTSTLDE